MGNECGVVLTDFLMPGSLELSYAEQNVAAGKYAQYGVTFSEKPCQAIQYQHKEYYFLNMTNAFRIDDVTLICQTRKTIFDATSKTVHTELISIQLPK